jgi:hypothetical protein
MNPAALAMLLVIAASPEAEILTLSGQQQTGQVQSLVDGQLTLSDESAATAVPAADLLELRFPLAAADDPLTQRRSIELRLVDGSLLYASAFVLDGRDVTVTSDLLGELQLPLAQVASVRLAELDHKIREAWDAIRVRETRTDLLVARKEDALDFVGGTIGGVTLEGLTILVNNREVNLPREKVFGLVFPRTPPARDASVCELTPDTGEKMRLQSVSISDGRLTGMLVAGPEIAIELTRVRSVDFGLGRVRYLADLTETASYEPVGFVTSEDVLRLRKNSNSLGRQLVVGQKTYGRGLWIHSGTTLKYRLNRDYRRLQTVLGMDHSSSECARLNPSVHVTIIGDGGTLLDADVHWSDEPQVLDLDVTGIRDLEIRVTPTNPQSIGACEHLALADARVIK